MNPWSVRSFDRADSGLYLDIVRLGYTLFSCARFPGSDPNQWCGNAGWMPGLPILTGLLVDFGMNAREAAFLISNIAFVGCLILLRRLFGQIAPNRDPRISLLIASVFPGGIYFHAVFPISLLMFFSILSLLLLTQQRFFLASIVSACGALSYATGFLLAGVVGCAAAAAPTVSMTRKLAKAAFYSAIAFSGFLIVLAMHRIATDHWNAFFLVQAKYGHGLHNPLLSITSVLESVPPEYSAPVKLVVPAQTLVICAAVLSLFTVMLMRREEITAIEWLAAIHVFLFWIFPLVMGPGVSPTRAQANLLPLTLLMARLPQAVQIPALIVFAALYFWGSIAFFESILV